MHNDAQLARHKDFDISQRLTCRGYTYSYVVVAAMALSKAVKGNDLVSQVPKIDLNSPNYDQSTYFGRVKHFFEVTNPATVFLSKKKLFQAKDLLEQYK